MRKKRKTQIVAIFAEHYILTAKPSEAFELATIWQLQENSVLTTAEKLRSDNSRKTPFWQLQREIERKKNFMKIYPSEWNSFKKDVQNNSHAMQQIEEASFQTRNSLWLYDCLKASNPYIFRFNIFLCIDCVDADISI